MGMDPNVVAIKMAQLNRAYENNGEKKKKRKKSKKDKKKKKRN